MIALGFHYRREREREEKKERQKRLARKKQHQAARSMSPSVAHKLEHQLSDSRESAPSSDDEFQPTEQQQREESALRKTSEIVVSGTKKASDEGLLCYSDPDTPHKRLSATTDDLDAMKISKGLFRKRNSRFSRMQSSIAFGKDNLKLAEEKAKRPLLSPAKSLFASFSFRSSPERKSSSDKLSQENSEK